jgi:hypothetical protein
MTKQPERRTSERRTSQAARLKEANRRAEWSQLKLEEMRAMVDALQAPYTTDELLDKYRWGYPIRWGEKP